MKLAIVGSVYIDEALAWEVICGVVETLRPECIISGGAEGVDTLARHAAQEYALPMIECLPHEQAWPAFKQRNLLIAELCDHLVRIKHPNSKTYGSGWTRDRAAELGKPTEEFVVG